MCYKCQVYGYLVASCSSLVRVTTIDGTPTEATELDFDMYIFKGEDSETDKEPTSDDVGLSCINQTLSTHLFIVKCVFSPPTEKDDWRKVLPSTHSLKLKIRVVK